MSDKSFRKLWELVMEWVNDGEQIGIIYLDFRIAIEKRLLPKIMTLGIDSELLCWLQE
jgi:hypothetical protein